MFRTSRFLFVSGSLSLALAAPVLAQARLASSPPRSVTKDAHPTIEQFLSPSSPLEIAVAKKVDRVAWVAYEKGMRNVYTAAAPDFKPVRLTKFMDDDGVDVGSVQLSDDGSIATFIRGAGANRVGWVANPSHDPNGGERAVWAARTDGSGAWRLAKLIPSEVGQPPAPGAGFGGRGGGGGPELSPDGKTVVWAREGQIFRAKVTKGAAVPMDTGGVAFIKEWGRQGSPRWSPDGSKLAFESDRGGNVDVYVMNLDGTGLVNLTKNPAFDGYIAWKPR